MKNPRLERLNQEHRSAQIRLIREKHREKQQLAEAKELTRKARTRRLCTRGGMLESFLEAPNILTDDDVMEFLTCIFDFNSVQRKLDHCGSKGSDHGRNLRGSGGRPVTKVRAQLYTGRADSCVLPKASCGKPDDFCKKMPKSSQGKHTFPCDGCAVYPFVLLRTMKDHRPQFAFSWNCGWFAVYSKSQLENCETH